MSKKTDRTTPTPRDVYYATRRVRFMLPEAKQTQLLDLLGRGHKGEDVHQAALDFYRNSQNALVWLQSALYLRNSPKGYAELSGQPGPIPARSLWVCPQCGFSWRVLRTGRPVPPCPHDGTTLVWVNPPPESEG